MDKSDKKSSLRERCEGGGPDLGKLPTFSCFLERYWGVFWTFPKQYILNKNAVLIQHFLDFDDLGSFVGNFSHGNLRPFPSNLLRLKTTVYKRFYYLGVWLTPSSLPLHLPTIPENIRFIPILPCK